MPGGSPGIPGWFIAVFVIAAVVGISISIWRVSVLRSGGLNPFVAREQLEAKLNQSLSTPHVGAEQPIEQRLAELQDLHARGVITDDELNAGRAKIIAGE
ncbi:MAG: SHOCT domain-containing protein [Actinobacteria bacterium]|nr:SHOCT domain-containing protein [Actinomycetota bacterium]MBO0836902.1 SHOCT domain-containing protein [Actinomycetota bacterium]